MRRWLTLMALSCAACSITAAAVAVPSALGAGNAVINDCQTNGKLTRSYTLAQLRHAQAIMPATVKEYTNCADVVGQAELAAVSTGRSPGGPGPGSGSGGSFLPTPVIVILVLLILAAVTFGAVAIRRRRQAGDDDAAGDGDADPPDGAADPPA